jgi:hypothetical protein
MSPSLSDLDPVIQQTFAYLAGAPSYQALAVIDGVSRQAVHKRVQRGICYLQAFRDEGTDVADGEKEDLHRQIQQLTALVAHLRRLLIIAGTNTKLLKWFKEKILRFYPRAGLRRFSPDQKRALLDSLEAYERAGGSAKDFCAAIEKSYDTLARWRDRFTKNGMAGLCDKVSRPRHFGHTLPSWVMDEIRSLIRRFPRWTAYQFCKYLRDNPAVNWQVCVQTIQRILNIETAKSEEEQARIKKRWAFAAGTTAWTLDFVCIWKDEFGRKLQLLTVSDLRSRYLFDCALFLNTSTELVMDHLETLFVKYGKPLLIKADNGPEFRLEFREQLSACCVQLLNSPEWYGQFNGAHERIHRGMRAYFDAFKLHHNVSRIVEQIKEFINHHNNDWTLDILGGKTPAVIFYTDDDFIPADVEVVAPYVKDGDFRVKFRNRNGQPGRLSVPAAPGIRDLPLFKNPPSEPALKALN